MLATYPDSYFVVAARALFDRQHETRLLMLGLSSDEVRPCEVLAVELDKVTARMGRAGVR
jgi:hypothetical protein